MIRRFAIACVVALLAIPVLAQEQTVPSDRGKEVADLKERLDNALKQAAAAHAETEKLKQAAVNTPENVAKLVKARVSDLEKMKSMPVSQACKAAGGKALITSDAKGNLTYAGCLL